MSKLSNFVNGVKKESERVKWPTKKDMVRYSITTVIFIFSLAIFFFVLDFVFAGIKSLVG